MSGIPSSGGAGAGAIADSGAGSARAGREAVLRLVRGVQLRLWLASIAQSALRGAWVGAGLVGVGATLHVVLRAHAIGRALRAGAGVLFGFTLAAAAAGRPALRGAAASADAWFGGRDLLSSAVD